MGGFVRSPTRSVARLPEGEGDDDTNVARPAESRAELRRCATRRRIPGTTTPPRGARQPNKKVLLCRPFSWRHHSASAAAPEQRTFRYKLRRRLSCPDAHTLSQKRIASWRLPFPRAAPRECK